MPSFTTLYRAFVMIAVGVISMELWHLCAPSSPQLQLVSRRAREIALTAWDRWQQDGEKGEATDATAEASTAGSEPITFQAPPDALPLSPVIPAMSGAAMTPNESSVQPATWPAPFQANASDNRPAPNADRMTELMAQLEELGGQEPRLAPWGSAGHVYRFCCQATWTENPQFTRHFESVAPEPLAAVEDVVAQVKSWRAEHQSRE